MKKQLWFLALAFLILSFFACDLEIPEKVVIKGSPEARFAANFNIGDYFNDAIDKIFDSNFNNNSGLILINCPNTAVKTFIIYSKVLDETINLNLSSDVLNAIGQLGEYKLDSKLDINTSSSGITIPAVNLDEFVKGFSFANYNTMLYISGSEIVDILTVDLKKPDITPQTGRNETNLGSSDKFYENALPAGLDIALKFDGNQISINPSIYIEEGKTITAGMLAEPKVKIEVAIWLPLVLEATGDGRKFELPALFNHDVDLFGRGSVNDKNLIAEFVESLKLEITLSGSNPFTKAELHVTSEGVSIKTPFGGNSLIFEISESDMNDINSHFPFAPKLEIVFKKGGKLSMPNDFRTSYVALTAKLNYSIDLGGGLQ